MEFPEPTSVAARTPWRRAPLAAAVAALGLYAVLLVMNIGAVAGGSDSSGYLNHAKLLASGHLHVAPRLVPGLSMDSAPSYLYVPLGFRPARDGNGLVPTYPSGLPLFIAAVEPLAGWRHAGDVVLLLHAIAGVLLTYLLARRLGLERDWSVLAATLVGASPVYLFMALQAMSDVPSLVWTTAAILAALKSRERTRWAVVAGVAVSVDVLLRPTNVLAFLPIALALGSSPKRWAAFLAGGIPGGLFFMLHSHAAYGSYLTTGYGNSARQFMASYVPGTVLHYVHWLPLVFTPLLVAFPGLAWVRGTEKRLRVLLGVWVLLYLSFYCTYECTHETWWYLRFLLPAAPALAVGSLLVIRALFAQLSSLHTSAAALSVLAVLALANSAYWVHELPVLGIGRNEVRYGVLSDWLKAHLPHDAVCVSMQATGALLYYTDYTFLRWDELHPDNVKGVEDALRAAKVPVYAVLFPYELDGSGALSRHMPGAWAKVGQVEDVSIWKLDLPAAKP